MARRDPLWNGRFRNRSGVLLRRPACGRRPAARWARDGGPIQAHLRRRFLKSGTTATDDRWAAPLVLCLAGPTRLKDARIEAPANRPRARDVANVTPS